MQPRTPVYSLFASAALLAASPAMAHPGHDVSISPLSSFVQGLAHPLSGADHILAMVMVGLFAVQLGGRALWVLPMIFLAGMAAGAAFGLSAGAPAWIEIGIALSVVLLGTLLVLNARLPVAAASGLVLGIALLHGHAHGAETPDGTSLSHLGGILLGTAVLHMAGVLAAVGLARMPRRYGSPLLRLVGGAGASAGVLLLAAA